MTEEPKHLAAHRHQPWVSSVTANVVARAGALVGAAIIARALGPTGRGIAATAILWPTIVSTVALISIPTATFFSARRGMEGLEVCLRISVVNAIALMAVSWALNALVLGGNSPSFAYANWYVFIIPLTIAGNVFGGALLGQGRVSEYWTTRLAGSLLTTAGVVVLAAFGRLSIEGVLITSLLGAFGVALLARRSLAKLELGTRPIDPGLTPEVLRFGGHALVTIVAAQLNLRLDQLLISTMLPASVLGEYVVAFSWSSTVYVIGSGMSTVVLSRTSTVDVGNPDSVRAAAASVRRAGLIGLCVSAGACLAAPLAIPIIFGPGYRSAIVPAMVLSIAAGPICVKGYLHEFGRGTGHPSIGRLPELVGLMVSAVSLPMMIRTYGALGAATVSVISYSAVVTTFIVRLTHTLRLPKRTLVPNAHDFAAVVSGTREYLRHHRLRINRMVSRQ